MVAELPWLWSGLGAYFVATLIAIYGVAPRYAGMPIIKAKNHEYIVLGFLVLGVMLLAIAISARWMRIGHGPWISLFELLMSQLWSLGLIFMLLYWRLPGLRPSAVIVLPVMWILGSWVLTLEPNASHFPATYYNTWKWVHVGLGKIFLALLLAAVGLAGVLILRQTQRGKIWFRSMPSDAIVDRFAWRFMMLALVFDSLMLIAGAVWAQDAWGRYWAWDALETSAFLTWLFLAIGLHVRLSYRVPPLVSGLIIIGIFVMAFATYFGTPYLSPAAHKGMV
ncbi:MAG: cytochrome c biogenesis protein CcsA [Gammaproteobacteria bacterium]|jgi:ABC-type transport system involved in cytochrome c biogenesis permease subunit